MPRVRTHVSAVAIAALVACGGDVTRPGEPIGRVGDEVVDAAVVRHVARRDGLDEASARAKVVDTLRLVAQRRERERARGGEPPPELPPVRRDQLVRGARARLWLTDVFEAGHRAADIPDGDPLLVRAAASPEHVHPQLVALCQIVVGPRDPADADGGAVKAIADVEERGRITSDEAWRARAREILDPIALRLRANVPEDDARPCELVGRLLRPDARERGDIVVELQGVGGFDLDACARAKDDGSCAEPTFAPEWVAAVRGTTRGFVGPFVTRFGLHLVFVQEVLPPRTLDDPATLEHVRESIVDRWRARELADALERMQQTRAVQLAAPEAAAP